MLHAVGEIAAAAAAAEALVLTAADALDAVVDSGRSRPRRTRRSGGRRRRGAARRRTAHAGRGQRLFDTGGASATSRKLNLDRHWRNARTVASHNPLAYKAHAAGNYVVNGDLAACQRLLLSRLVHDCSDTYADTACHG